MCACCCFQLLLSFAVLFVFLQESLFQRISRNLEVSGRVGVLNKKLDYCHELVEILSSHSVAQHSSRLEWIIIALIAIEIILDVKELMIENRRERMRDQRALQKIAAAAAMQTTATAAAATASGSAQ